MIYIFFPGKLDKKRGLSTKAREFLLLEGPRLIYIDPSSKQMKGEVPWSAELRTELKNFRTLDVHTPNRTYHLFDKSNNAMKWSKKIEQVKRFYFPAAASGGRSMVKAAGVVVGVEWEEGYREHVVKIVEV